MTHNTATKKAILLMGPTASGKSHLAMALAAHDSRFEIISVDSAQIYKSMNIGTAKPSAQEQKLVPHHLLDLLDPSQFYSVAQFCEDAFKVMDDIHARGKIALCVGGTMLYFKALREGLSDLPETNPTIRQYWQSQLEQHGIVHLHQQLCQRDPIGGLRLKTTDTQRITRALEIIDSTGRLYSQVLDQPRITRQDWQFLPLAIEPENRTALHDQIKTRFLTMLQLGFLEEVKQLQQRGDLHLDLPAIRTVGYRQAWLYLSGHIGHSELLEQAIAATRQLAKRQITWLRSDENRVVISREIIKNLPKPALETVYQQILDFLHL